jgi:hypothetical protein
LMMMMMMMTMMMMMMMLMMMMMMVMLMSTYMAQVSIQQIAMAAMCFLCFDSSPSWWSLVQGTRYFKVVFFSETIWRRIFTIGAKYEGWLWEVGGLCKK